MKHFSKFCFFLCLLLVTSACNDKTADPADKSDQGYVRMKFNYLDGATENSRIAPVLVPSSLRTTAPNLVIEGTVDLPAGDYGVLDFRPGAWLKINSKVTIQNMNLNSAVTINVYKEADFTLNGSLNMTGFVTFLNESPKFVVNGSMEMQNNGNVFESYYGFSVNEFQINDPTSHFQLRGCDSKFIVANAINLNGKTEKAFVLVDGAQVITNTLNVNNKNVLSGSGSIKVLNNLNLNNSLTTSKDIKFCWVDSQGKDKSINQPANLGAAVRDCKAGCNSLPVTIVNFTAKPAGIDHVAYSFMVTENTNLKSFEVQYSKDAKTWTTRYLGKPTELIAGKEFKSQIFIGNL